MEIKLEKIEKKLREIEKNINNLIDMQKQMEKLVINSVAHMHNTIEEMKKKVNSLESELKRT